MADFETFYRELHPRLVTTLAAVSGDRDLAIDAADEAAARALAHWDQVEVMDKPDGWLYRVGLNYLRRQVRRRGFEQTWLRRQRSQRHVDGPTGEIWNLVADLAPRQREAIVLRYLGQLTEPEIAAVMGVRRGTVSSTLRAAHANLGDSLADNDLQAPTVSNRPNGGSK